MTFCCRFPVLANLVALAVPAFAQSGFPFQDESLHYSVNWPSGLSLGDVQLSARHSPKQWDFEMTLDAAIPAFTIADSFHAATNGELCSEEFERNLSHGSKKSEEKITFDYAGGKAKRSTKGGGTSELDVKPCARDALAFLYYARLELGQGRVPPHQDVFFGSAYAARLEYAGAKTLPGTSEVTDSVVVHVKGPSSNSTFEILFARDPARTPLLVKIPSSLGAITLELVR